MNEITRLALGVVGALGGAGAYFIGDG